MRRILVCFLLLPLGLAACSGGPNVKSAKDYNSPPAPPVRNPLYEPYAAYGEANATCPMVLGHAAARTDPQSTTSRA